MPPKVTDTRTAQNEALVKVEEQTAADARKIVASLSDDFFDCVQLMCMLGIEPDGLKYKKVEKEHLEEQEATRTRASSKTGPKKRATKKTAKKAVKKTAKKTAKKATKKTTKKTAKKATKKTAKKAQ